MEASIEQKINKFPRPEQRPEAEIKNAERFEESFSHERLREEEKGIANALAENEGNLAKARQFSNPLLVEKLARERQRLLEMQRRKLQEIKGLKERIAE